MITILAFYLFAALTVASAILVIFARNPVHSVLWLIVAFFNAAGLMLLLGAEFIAMLLVIVYVGAVAVLFLFVVMMLDIDFVALKQGFQNYVVVGALVALALLAEIGIVAAAATFGGGETFDPSPGAPTNAEALSRVLYTDYLLLFQMSGIVLLVAMMGAIVLTLRSRPNVKRQNISDQVARNKESAMEVRQVKSGQGL